MPEKKKTKLHPAEGHRDRLRKRFMQGGLDAFLDYEIVELLLTLGTPRRDCKQMAKEAIKKFGGLRQVLDASAEELREIDGIGPVNQFGLKLFQAISERYAKEKIGNKVLLDSPEAVFRYLQEKIGREKKEHFVTLSLDTRKHLIKISDVSIGILNANLVHPREVFKEAISSHAASLIVAHNHPSGDTEPSDEDLKVTERLVQSGNILGVKLVDHVIVCKNKFLSFKEHSYF